MWPGNICFSVAHHRRLNFKNGYKVCILLDLSRNSTSLVLICKAPHPQVLAQDKQSILSLPGAESRKNIHSETIL